MYTHWHCARFGIVLSPCTVLSRCTFPADPTEWVSSFCHPVCHWTGLALWRPIDMVRRELVQKGCASLLDLRSYLFSRQCTLLLFLQRPWEVAQRALELLHNSVQELHLLEVPF